MKKEIERRFLVNKDLIDLDQFPQHIITQGYILTPDRNTMRIRIIQDTVSHDMQAVITIKEPTGNVMSSYEYEFAVDTDHAWKIFDTCKFQIKKTRTYVPIADFPNLQWHVDSFHASDINLVIAEIELQNYDDVFPQPVWLGKEITNNKKKYSNYSLAKAHATI